MEEKSLKVLVSTYMKTEEVLNMELGSIFAY